MVLSWHAADGSQIARTVYRPDSADLVFEHLGIGAVAQPVADDVWRIEVSADRFAKCVLLTGVDDVSDNAFDVEPGGSVAVLARAERRCRVRVHAVNSLDSVSVQIGNP